MSYCNNAKKAIVTFALGDYKDVVIVLKPPIEITTESITIGYGNDGKKCWDFYSSNGVFQTFACCKVAEYRAVEGDVNPGWQGSTRRMCMFCDGKLLIGTHWYYGDGYHKLREVNQYPPQRIAYNIAGNCDSCIETGCKITISNTQGTVYMKQGKYPLNYDVACDDQCPPGYCKCECTNYPGYCCYDKNGNPL